MVKFFKWPFDDLIVSHATKSQRLRSNKTQRQRKTNVTTNSCLILKLVWFFYMIYFRQIMQVKGNMYIGSKPSKIWFLSMLFAGHIHVMFFLSVAKITTDDRFKIKASTKLYTHLGSYRWMRRTEKNCIHYDDEYKRKKRYTIAECSIHEHNNNNTSR